MSHSDSSGSASTVSNHQYSPEQLTEKIVCNRFNLISSVNGSTLSLALDTDLPDSTVVMVSVDRSYWETDNPETEYAIDYLSEGVYSTRSTVAQWRATHDISIADDLWQSHLRAHQAKTAKLGFGFDVSSISKNIKISMVAPVNQPDPRFGEGNENLCGTTVPTSACVL